MRYQAVKNLVVFGVMCSMAGTANAQLINYQRRDKFQLEPDVVQVAAAIQTDTAQSQIKIPSQPEVVSNNSGTSFEVLVASQPEIQSRVERIYDMNRDGRLQEDEIMEFYSDVVSSVERRGSFSVSSPLLKSYDKDKDGKITRVEIGELKSDLNE